jgi:hypothetical protein
MTSLNLTSLVEQTKQQMTAITGLPPDTISRCDRAEDGWMLSIDMLEHRSVPRTQDLLASFEVLLDEEGQVRRWRRTGRFVRGQQQA